MRGPTPRVPPPSSSAATARAWESTANPRRHAAVRVRTACAVHPQGARLGAGRAKRSGVIVDLPRTIAHLTGGEPESWTGRELLDRVQRTWTRSARPITRLPPARRQSAMVNGRSKLILSSRATLYDLDGDPEEQTDLSTAQPDLARSMTDWAAFEAALAETTEVRQPRRSPRLPGAADAGRGDHGPADCRRWARQSPQPAWSPSSCRPETWEMPGSSN
jgi:hypothetical protein